jgi:hypothetical protein
MTEAPDLDLDAEDDDADIEVPEDVADDWHPEGYEPSTEDEVVIETEHGEDV